MKRQKGKKKGPTKEKVFGCDLGTHLEGTGQDVPQVLKQCAEFIEEHGIVDGIYRLSGISSNIQKLRQEFDTEKTVDLSKDVYLQDIHCVSSLCKAYFRELPNPLLVYQLYDKFADAVNTQMEADRLLKIRHVLQELPLPHYRTLEYLMRHLLRMASNSPKTNMHSRNLAIVWAPNLLRSKEIETSGFNGTAAFMEVRVQSIVVEFILNHVHQLFSSSDRLSEQDGDAERCQSLPCLSPRIEQMTGRTHPSQIPHILHLGDGPPAMKPYHTIIELPDNRRKGSLKAKKWRSIFNLGRSGNDSKRKLCRNEGKDLKSSSLTLRPAKSMDSLSSAPFTSDGSPHHGDVRSPLSRRDSFSSPPLERDIFLLPPPLAVGKPVLRGGPNSPRSAKEARERAGRRVALHISEPFSVSLPSHVTTLLPRNPGPQAAGILSTGWDEHTEQAATLAQDPGDEEDEEALALSQEISWELQDTFSFLDSQDTMELGDAEMQEELGRPLRTPEEMDPSESLPAFEHGALRLDMSIESQLMELNEGGLLAYGTQLHPWEFSVEPPCEDEWGLDQVQPLCSIPSLPLLSGEQDPRVPEPRDPTPSSTGTRSSESGKRRCSTTGDVTGQEDPNEMTDTEVCLSTGQEDPRAVTGTEICSSTGDATGQEDPNEMTGTEVCSSTGQEDPRVVTGTEVCSSTGDITGQEDPNAVTGTEVCSSTGQEESRALTGTEICSSTGDVTGQEDPNAVTGTEGCSTTGGVLELGDPTAESRGIGDCWARGNVEGELWEGQEKDLGVQGEVPGEGLPLTAAPMRLESSMVQYHHSRALPVVPPKPHYALLPPALKGRPRPPASCEHPPITPSPRRLAWRKKGSQSFDEVVARRREQQWVDLAQPRSQAQSRALLRGDSLPCPQNRLSLPAPTNLPLVQPRCHSLALEGEGSE